MASTSAPEGEQSPQEEQRAPGLPRAEFIEDVGKFLEGETGDEREREREKAMATAVVETEETKSLASFFLSFSPLSTSLSSFCALSPPALPLFAPGFQEQGRRQGHLQARDAGCLKKKT